MADVGAEIGEEGFRVFDPLYRTEARLGLGVVAGGETLNLLVVKHRITFLVVHLMLGCIGRVASSVSLRVMESA